LESTKGSTYVGATVDLEHRLRQHNKEIKGGATATSVKVLQGETWRRVCHIRHFPDWTAALQFEWRFKQISRKIVKQSIVEIQKSGKPLVRRMVALRTLLSLERSTTKAVPYSEWETLPEIIWEQEGDKQRYENIPF